MNRQASLATVADVLLDEATPPHLLHDTLEIYRDLLLTASGLDLGAEDSLVPVDTGSGVAIGATWAALCIDDELRTQRFAAGLYAAVADRIRNQPEKAPVHVLYAGTGPFATLALPVMTRFRPDQLQFTFLEINSVSLTAVRQCVHALGLDEYVRDTIAGDASSLQLTDRDVDILLSETMQFSLVDEMQVPITLNLLCQLPVTTVLIPERITLRLGQLADSPGQPLVADFGEILTIDASSLRAYQRRPETTDFPSLTLPLPGAGGLFAIRTLIQVYGNLGLTDYESGLTIPEYIGRFPDEEGMPSAAEFTYQVHPTPYLRIAYLNDWIATPVSSENTDPQMPHLLPK